MQSEDVNVPAHIESLVECYHLNNCYELHIQYLLKKLLLPFNIKIDCIIAYIG
jgi:hypothetical protein